MPITTRSDFQSTLKDNTKQQRAIFEALSGELTRLITRYADVNGKIPPQQSQALRDEAGAIVRKYFVHTRKATASEHRAESTRLHELIATAQQQMRGATERQKTELRSRVTFLGQRLDMLEKQGLLVESINTDGQGLTPFARSLMSNIRGAVTSVVKAHAAVVAKAKQRAHKPA